MTDTEYRAELARLEAISRAANEATRALMASRLPQASAPAHVHEEAAVEDAPEAAAPAASRDDVALARRMADRRVAREVCDGVNDETTRALLDRLDRLYAAYRIPPDAM